MAIITLKYDARIDEAVDDINNGRLNTYKSSDELFEKLGL